MPSPSETIETEELRRKLTEGLADSLKQLRIAETETMTHGEFIGMAATYSALLLWLERKSILKNEK